MFGGRVPPGPAGGAHSASPDPLAGLRGAASRQGWGRRGGEGEGEGDERKRGGRERRGKEGGKGMGVGR